MTSGRLVGSSKIDKHNLVQPVMDLKRLGMSYSEIIHEINNNYGVQLNKANLTSFFNRSDNQKALDTTDKDDTDLSNLYVVLKGQLYEIRRDLQHNMERLYHDIDSSELKPQDRANLKKSLKYYDKRLFDGLKDGDRVILNAVSSLNESTQSMNQLLLDMSDALCPNCRRIVSECSDKILKENNS